MYYAIGASVSSLHDFCTCSTYLFLIVRVNAVAIAYMRTARSALITC